MRETSLSEPKAFFDELGGLHDARIIAFSWSSEEKVLRIGIDDLNSNFLDLPEYQGLRPVEIAFISVTYLDCDMQISRENFSIYDMEIRPKEGFLSVDISCAPSGYFKCRCETIRVIDKAEA